jgi:hypothetical protein
VDALPAGSSAISISAADLRVSTEGALSNSRAQTLASEIVFEPVYAINHSKSLQVIYATSQARVDATAYHLNPGILLLDVIRQRRGLENVAPIFGLRLKDTQGRDTIVALYHRSASGYVSGPQISIYPEDLELVLTQFRTAQEVREPAQVSLFGHKELLEARSSLSRYPHKPMLGITPKHLVWVCIMLGSLAFAVMSAAGARQAWKAVQLQGIQTASAEARLHGEPAGSPRLTAQSARHVAPRRSP